MQTNVIPEQLTGVSHYSSNNELLGMGELTLPNIQFMTETISGAGIAGEYDNPIPGLTQSLEATYNFRDITKQQLQLLRRKSLDLTSYANLQAYDAGTGEYQDVQLKITIRAKVKSSNLGVFNTGATGGVSVVVEILYLKVEVDSEKMLEIDKLNYIYYADGADWFEMARKNIGK